MGLTGMPEERNIVATVNLDCRLDLKTIALHARNAEYNPKVLLCFTIATSLVNTLLIRINCLAFCRCDYAHS